METGELTPEKVMEMGKMRADLIFVRSACRRGSAQVQTRRASAGTHRGKD